MSKPPYSPNLAPATFSVPKTEEANESTEICNYWRDNDYITAGAQGYTNDFFIRSASRIEKIVDASLLYLTGNTLKSINIVQKIDIF